MARQDKTGNPGIEKTRQEKIRRVRAKKDKTGQGKTRKDKTRQDRGKQYNKTIQEKIRHGVGTIDLGISPDIARQDKTKKEKQDDLFEFIDCVDRTDWAGLIGSAVLIGSIWLGVSRLILIGHTEWNHSIESIGVKCLDKIDWSDDMNDKTSRNKTM